MEKNQKLKYAFCANALIVILELIALALNFSEGGLGNFRFYTQDSNYLTLAASLLFCIYALGQLRRTNPIPRWVRSLRYISVSCLMVTFFVVIFVLMPMADENPLALLYANAMLYQHTLCPILSAFSFFAFETDSVLPKSDRVNALIPTLIYAVILIVLNICKVLEGPYPFLMVYAQPWYLSVVWCIVILGLAWLLAFGIWKLNNFISNRMD